MSAWVDLELRLLKNKIVDKISKKKLTGKRKTRKKFQQELLLL